MFLLSFNKNLRLVKTVQTILMFLFCLVTGAHICGLISKFVLFRLHRIVALDPARPLVTSMLSLGSGDAAAVHVLHTNAGHYGEAGRAGHVDFCINGGKIQPFCENSGSKYA